MEEMVMALMVLGIVGGSFLFVGWIIWIVSRRRRERQQHEIELRSRMLEKFGSSDEFVGFMQTDAGKKFLETSSLRGEKSLHARVMSSLSSGVILILLGGAFFFLARMEGDTGLLFPATILSAIGLGLIITAVIFVRMSKSPLNGGSGSANVTVD